MRPEKDSIATSVALAAWVILYSYALNALKYALGIAITGAFIVLILGHVFLIKSERKGIPFTMAYTAYVILALFSLAKSIHPAVQWASEFLLFSVLSVVFIAFYDILVKVSAWELLPQLVLLYALAIALLGVQGWLVIALLGLATALVCSIRSLLGYLMSLVFALLPFIGIPAVVYNAEELPHIVLPGLRVGSIDYITALVTTYIASAIAGGIGGILAMTFWKSLTKSERVSRSVMNSFLIAVSGIIFVVIVTVITHMFTPWLNEILVTESVGLTLVLSFTVAFLINLTLLRRKLQKIMKEFKKHSEYLLYRLDNVREAVNALSTVSVANEKIEYLRSRTNEIITNVRRMKEQVSRNPSLNALKSASNELKLIEKNISELEKEIVETFSSLATTVQSLKPIMDPYVIIPDDLWLKAVTATKVEGVDDVLIKANALRKVSEKLCTYLEEAINQSLTELENVLGVKTVPERPLKCSNWRNPISALKGIVREYTLILAKNKHAIQQTYNKLLRLKEAFLDLERDIKESNLQSTNFGTLVSEASSILSEVPDVIPSTHSAIRIIKVAAEKLREVIDRLPKALKSDLNLLLGSSETGITTEVASTLHALSDVTEKLNYLYETLESISEEKIKGSYAEVIASYESILPKLLRRVVNNLRELTAMRRRTGLIPVVMEYLDYLLRKGGGTLALEELPFKRDASIHFIQLYAINRKDIEVQEGGIRVKESG